jgi:DNA-binding transcriptional LysR family regulator
MLRQGIRTAEEADLGIAFDVPSRTEIAIIGRKTRPICAVVAPGHPICAVPTAALDDLVEFPAVLPAKSFGIRRVLDRAFTKCGRQPRIVAESNSLHFMRTLACYADIVAYMPNFVVAPEIRSGALVAVPTGEPTLNNAELHVCVKHGRKRSAAADAFETGLLEVLARG